MIKENLNYTLQPRAGEVFNNPKEFVGQTISVRGILHNLGAVSYDTHSTPLFAAFKDSDNATYPTATRYYVVVDAIDSSILVLREPLGQEEYLASVGQMVELEITVEQKRQNKILAKFRNVLNTTTKKHSALVHPHDLVITSFKRIP